MSLAIPTTETPDIRENVSWSEYLRMLDEIGDGHTRLTYDSGRLQIMAPSVWHDSTKKIVARLIEAYADFHDIDLIGIGSTTLRREELLKGLEPDECYYVSSPKPIYNPRNIDPDHVPRPDLALEIDISRPGINRENIYAALGVPELWKYGRMRVAYFELRDGMYIPAAQSLAFPGLPAETVNQMLELAEEKGQSHAVKAFRAWMAQKQG